MIVVANPSGRAGQSFKGLHAYCAHDPDRAESTERVDWISTRNLCSEPELAWKEMAATAMMADRLKAQAGVQAGRKSTKGPVLHLVLSFDEKEDTSRDAMEGAADKMLAALGADPARMRGKAKPKRRQFADEHQAIFYAHSDTKNTHLHVMVNTVHPEHGTRLPTSNNYNKLQAWALRHTKEVGTATNYPVREENAEARARGDYVKGDNRSTRNMWELEQAVRPALKDGQRSDAILAEQKAKDAALLKHTREVHARQRAEAKQLDADFKAERAKLGAELKTQINRAKAKVREEYRPAYRELKTRQAKERDVFNALEEKFFGRMSNAAKALREEWREPPSGMMSRGFGIVTRAGDRKAALDRAQAREEAALRSEERAKLKDQTDALKVKHSAKLAEQRSAYLDQRAEQKAAHEAEAASIKEAWNKREAERRSHIEGKVEAEPLRRDLILQQRNAAAPRALMDRMRAMEESRKLQGDFAGGREQKRERDQELDRERDED